MLKKIRPYMMPIAMTVGAVFYRLFGPLSFLTPYLIFSMLFLTYCKMELSKIRLSRLHLWMILIQILGSIGIESDQFHPCPGSHDLRTGTYRHSRTGYDRHAERQRGKYYCL